MKHLIKLSNYYHLSTVCKNPKLTYSQCASNCHRREESKAFVSQSDHDCLLLRKIGESETVKKVTTATVIMKKISGSILFFSLHALYTDICKLLYTFETLSTHRGHYCNPNYNCYHYNYNIFSSIYCHLHHNCNFRQHFYQFYYTRATIPRWNWQYTGRRSQRSDLPPLAIKYQNPCKVYLKNLSGRLIGLGTTTTTNCSTASMSSTTSTASASASTTAWTTSTTARTTYTTASTTYTTAWTTYTTASTTLTTPTTEANSSGFSPLILTVQELIKKNLAPDRVRRILSRLFQNLGAVGSLDEAQSTCQSLGRSLARFSTPGEHAAIVDAVRGWRDTRTDFVQKPAE